MRFVDTNILLYAVSTAPSVAAKTEVASRLLRQRDLVLSTQVLQEFYMQVTRPTRSDAITHREAAALIDTWMRWPVQDLTAGIVRNALQTRERWQLSYWDAAIIEAARAAGCDTVLSEDMQHLQSFDGVQVINPFATIA